MQQPYPKPIIEFLREYHAHGITEEDCRACSSPCCSLGGFAILENVIQIYELYRAGSLNRADYEHEPALSFADFVFKYFDIYKRKVPVEGAESTLMLFHMRSLSPQNNLISIPNCGDYWEVRTELFHQNPWLNRGCVFLSHKVGNWPEDDGDASRHCTLHTRLSSSHVTAKPIDCVFYTCNKPIQGRVPTAHQSEEWFRLLATNFPNSLERFERLIGDGPPDKRTAGGKS
jgi:hypothetical protein